MTTLGLPFLGVKAGFPGSSMLQSSVKTTCSAKQKQRHQPLAQPAAALVAADGGCLLAGSGRSGVPRDKTHTMPAASIYLSRRGPSGRDVAMADLAAAPLTCSRRSVAFPLVVGSAGGEESGAGGGRSSGWSGMRWG